MRLVNTAVLAAVMSAASAFDLGDHVVGTLGAHLGIPIGPAVSGSVIIGDVEGPGAGGAFGAVLLGEVGMGAGKFAFGVASLTGNERGPYLLDRWHDWYSGDHFMWPFSGWSLRGVLMHTWYRTPITNPDRDYAGVELELVGSTGERKQWGGLRGLNLTVGVLKRTDSGEIGLDGLSDKEEDEWMMSVEVGIGF